MTNLTLGRSLDRNFELLASHQDFSALLDEIVLNDAFFADNDFRQKFEGSPFKDTSFIPLRMTYDFEEEPTEEELIKHLKEVGITNTDAADTAYYEHFPNVYQAVMAWSGIVKSEQIGRVLITKMPPKTHIKAHKDFGKYHDLYDRIHLVVGGKGCHFRSGREVVKMLPGEVWWFYNNEEHEVWNDSDADRIHVVIDFKLKGQKRAYDPD